MTGFSSFAFRYLLCLSLAAPTLTVFGSSVSDGKLGLQVGDLEPGRSIELSGQWHYKPGYLIPDSEKPETSITATAEEGRTFAETITTAPEAYIPVPVPQILNRIQWWLDDSEDFKKDETARLKKLGFDTDKAEDGWYRLELDLPQLPDNRRLFLEFDGVAMKCEVFWNGVRLGEHAGMFSRFSFDATPHVQSGKNLLAVFVSMEKIKQDTLSMGEAVTVNLTASKVKTMSKAMFGPLAPGHENRDYDLHGIWQPVRLVTRGTGKLNDVWFLPALDGGKVQVEALGVGTTITQTATLTATWTDVTSNTELAKLAPSPVELGTSLTVTTLSLTGVSPKLWTPANPHLYRLDVVMSAPNGAVLDRWSKNVGFRTFTTSGSQLLLNGKPYWLRGANHLPYGKNPVDPELPRKLIQSMHDNNHRVTRTHCTPWNETWLNAADEIGLGVSIEGMRPWAFAGNVGATPPDLFQHWKMEQEDVIRRARNHPSVLIWTIGNEMLIRDHDNLEKWGQLSEIIRATRQADPYRPIVASSSYERSVKVYDEVLKPNGFDDGDIDDIHSYKGWYSDSPFLTDSVFKPTAASRRWSRPLIGQEMSTGYPNLDNGLPTSRYTENLMTPQSWIGKYAYPGSDPAIFGEHLRAVTKRWAEQLRYQRGNRTAGFLLFANECWYSHSYDAKRVQPYPVVDGVKHAWAPVGLALEINRRRYFSEEEFMTAVYVTNDDESFRDLPAGELFAVYRDAATGVELKSTRVARTPALPYYETTTVPLRLMVPATTQTRQLVDLMLQLRTPDGQELGRTLDKIELFERMPGVDITHSTKIPLLSGKKGVDELTTGSGVYWYMQHGGTAILLSPDSSIVKRFPNDIISASKSKAEFADWSPLAKSNMVKGMQAMDLKWWGRKDDDRVFVANQAHRLNPAGKARELVRLIPAHSYTKPEKVPELVMAGLFEISVGKGRLWVCNLDLEASYEVDPAARLFTRNLLEAARDAESTKDLVPLLTPAEIAARIGKEAKAGSYAAKKE